MAASRASPKPVSTVCAALAAELKLYRECERYYPFVLGAQPVRPIDLAAFYATIANEGFRPEPHVIDSVEQDGRIIYRHDPKSAVTIASVDRAAFYQLKSILQGVLARGTARSMAGISSFVAGKTGTSDDENDAWFVGFTNDVTVAVWVGYDNADGKRRTLGEGATGGGTAVPIFEPIMQAVWAHVAPRTALAPPSPEARRQLSCKPGKIESGSQRPGQIRNRVPAGGRQGRGARYPISPAVARELHMQRESLAEHASDRLGLTPVLSRSYSRYYSYGWGWSGWGYSGGWHGRGYYRW